MTKTYVARKKNMHVYVTQCSKTDQQGIAIYMQVNVLCSQKRNLNDGKENSFASLHFDKDTDHYFPQCYENRLIRQLFFILAVGCALWYIHVYMAHKNKYFKSNVLFWKVRNCSVFHGYLYNVAQFARLCTCTCALSL